MATKSGMIRAFTVAIQAGLRTSRDWDDAEAAALWASVIEHPDSDVMDAFRAHVMSATFWPTVGEIRARLPRRRALVNNSVTSSPTYDALPVEERQSVGEAILVECPDVCGNDAQLDAECERRARLLRKRVA